MSGRDSDHTRPMSPSGFSRAAMAKPCVGPLVEDAEARPLAEQQLFARSLLTRSSSTSSAAGQAATRAVLADRVGLDVGGLGRGVDVVAGAQAELRRGPRW